MGRMTHPQAAARGGRAVEHVALLLLRHGADVAFCEGALAPEQVVDIPP